jgi:hypothetical protein
MFTEHVGTYFGEEWMLFRFSLGLENFGLTGINCYLTQFGKRSLDRISLDRNCHFSLDRKF